MARKKKSEAAAAKLVAVVDAKELRIMVDQIAPVLRRASPSPVHLSLFIRRRGNQLVVRGVGPEVSVERRTAAVDFTRGDDGVRCAVASGELAAWLSKADPTGTVELRITDKWLAVQGDGVGAQFQTSNLDEPREEERNGDRHEVKADALLTALRACARATAKETSRYAVSGIYLNGNMVAATDGRRLHLYQLDGLPTGIIVPSETVKQMTGLFTDEDVLSIWCDGFRLVVQDHPEDPTMVCASSLIEGTFPPYEKVQPDDKTQTWRVKAKVDTFVHGVRAAAANANEETKATYLVKRADGKLAAVYLSESNEARAIIADAEVTAGDPQVSVDPRFAVDAAEAGRTEFVEISGAEWGKPLVFKAGLFTAVVMPVNLGDERTWDAIKQCAEEFVG